MAKKNKSWYDEDKEPVPFEEEDLEEFGELVEAVEESEPEPEPEPEPVVEAPKPKAAKKNQNGSKVVVQPLQVWVFAEPNLASMGLTRVARGNMLSVIGDAPYGWFKVSVPKSGGAVEGFIEAFRVKVV